MLMFMRTIGLIFSQHYQDLIQENLERFYAMTKDTGKIVDVFLGERTVIDWVEFLLDKIRGNSILPSR